MKTSCKNFENDIVSIDKIDTMQEFLNLKDIWDNILAESHDNNIFLTFEWLSTWWKYFGDKKELFILSMRNDEELVAVAPLMRSRKNGLKVLEFMGTGRSDYLNFIVNKKINREKAIDCFFSYLKNNLNEWDVINLCDMALTPDDSTVLDDNAKKYKFVSSKLQHTACPYLAIDDSWDGYLATKTTKHRKNIMRLSKEISKNGELEIISRGNKLDSQIILQMVSDIETESWKVDVGNPRLSSEKANKFFKDIFKEFGDKHWLEAWILKMSGMPIAYIVNFLYNNKIYFYNVAYKKQYSKYSAGTYLTSVALKDAFDRKISEYDFLRGSELYKTLWAKTSRELYQIVFYKKTLKSVLAFNLLFKVRWFLKKYLIFKKLNSFRIKNSYKIKALFSRKPQLFIHDKSDARVKILYHHRTRGQGVEGVHIRGIVDALEELGNKVLLISPPGVNPTVEQKQISQNRSKASLIWKSVSKYTPQILFELLEVGYNFTSYIKIEKMIKENTISAIYERYAFFGFSGSYLAKRHNVPFILEVNEISGIERQRGQILIGLSKKIEKIVFQYADAIVTVSGFLKKEIIKMGIESSKIHVIPNAIDMKDINITEDTSNIKERLNLKGKFVLTFVGSFCRWDKLDFLVEAFGELSKMKDNLQLVLIGDGKERKSLEKLIAETGLKDKIWLTGKIDRRKVLEYISATDICVISHTNPFGSPVVLFEYMGSGRPVIAPRFGPIEDIIVDNRNGIIFEPLNKESFKNRILELINDQKKRESIGAAARDVVLNNHLWIKNGAKVINIINSLNLKAGSQQEKVKVPILIYHNIEEDGNGSIYTISAEKFKEHLEWLYQEGYIPITLSEFTSCKFNGGRLPKKPVIITFDDGYRNCYEIAFPILREHGFQASFFITTKWTGTENYMNWEQLRTLKNKGMEIGSHGHSHTALSRLDRHAIKYELENSKLLIEEYLRDKIDFVSVPGGYFNNSIKQIAKEVGYKGVLTSRFGTNDKTSDLYELRRIGVRGYYTPQYLEKLMNNRTNFTYRIDYLLRAALKKSLGERGYRWLLKYCFGLV